MRINTHIRKLLTTAIKSNIVTHKYAVTKKKYEREKDMTTHSIRLGSILSFDADQEKDIISAMEYLNSTHSTGKFFSNLIRVVFDNPEIITKAKDSVEKGKLIKQIEDLGLSPQRDKFFKDITLEVSEMKRKVDKIYEMSLKTYTLAQMGKHLGLEEKSENNLAAEFILEKQLKELQDALGISLGASVFESNKLDKMDVTRKKAEDILEYIIETYDSILNELRTRFEIQKIEVPVQQVVTSTVQVPVQMPTVQVPIQQVPVQTVQQTQTEQVAQTQTVDTTQESSKGSSDSAADNEIIDFGNADMGLLENFFGD